MPGLHGVAHSGQRQSGKLLAVIHGDSRPELPVLLEQGGGIQRLGLAQQNRELAGPGERHVHVGLGPHRNSPVGGGVEGEDEVDRSADGLAGQIAQAPSDSQVAGAPVRSMGRQGGGP